MALKEIVDKVNSFIEGESSSINATQSHLGQIKQSYSKAFVSQIVKDKNVLDYQPQGDVSE